MQVVELVHFSDKSLFLLNLAVHSHVLDIGNDVRLFRFHRKLVVDNLLGRFQLCDFRVKLRIIFSFIHLKNAV